MQTEQSTERAATYKLLDQLAQAGYTRVAIRRSDYKIPVSVAHPFVNVNLFAAPKCQDESGWPAVWRIVEAAGVWGGAGGEDSAQLKRGRLLDGIYRLEQGVWELVSS